MANLYMKSRVSSPPTMTWYMLMRRPEIIIAIARPSRIGQNELGGIWMAAISAAVTGAGLGGGARPSHGSGLATLPARAVLITFPMNTRNESAIVKAPMVETRFQKFQPRSPA